MNIKKIYISLIALMATMSINAQVINVYRNSKLVDSYRNSDKLDYEVEFCDTLITKGSVNGHKWVQLWKDGPKFAEFNIGARITDYSGVTEYNIETCGYHFAWGGIRDREDDHRDGEKVHLSDNEDTAITLWGTDWRMPTKEELCKLCNRKEDAAHELSAPLTEWTWCNGTEGSQYAPGCTLKGYKVSGVGDYAENSIFLPATGFTLNKNVQDYVGNHCMYWSNTNARIDLAWSLNALWDDETMSGDTGLDSFSRNRGHAVRAVLAE